VSVIRRQFVFLLIVGCVVSLAAEGRVVPWLALDAAVSAAFMPVVQLLGFAAIWRMRIAGTRARERDVLGFLDGNTCWLWWWCALAVPVALVPPQRIGPWILPALVSAIVPMAWSIGRDARWLRADRGRTARQAFLDVAALRLVTWGAGVVWFFGIAIWYGELPKVVMWWHR
jgi:hypothetical protein